MAAGDAFSWLYTAIACNMMQNDACAKHFVDISSKFAADLGRILREGTDFQFDNFCIEFVSLLNKNGYKGTPLWPGCTLFDNSPLDYRHGSCMEFIRGIKQYEYPAFYKLKRISCNGKLISPESSYIQIKDNRMFVWVRMLSSGGLLQANLEQLRFTPGEESVKITFSQSFNVSNSPVCKIIQETGNFDVELENTNLTTSLCKSVFLKIFEIRRPLELDFSQMDKRKRNITCATQDTSLKSGNTEVQVAMTQPRNDSEEYVAASETPNKTALSQISASQSSVKSFIDYHTRSSSISIDMDRQNPKSSMHAVFSSLPSQTITTTSERAKPPTLTNHPQNPPILPPLVSQGSSAQQQLSNIFNVPKRRKIQDTASPPQSKTPQRSNKATQRYQSSLSTPQFAQVPSLSQTMLPRSPLRASVLDQNTVINSTAESILPKEATNYTHTLNQNIAETIISFSNSMAQKLQIINAEFTRRISEDIVTKYQTKCNELMTSFTNDIQNINQLLLNTNQLLQLPQQELEQRLNLT